MKVQDPSEFKQYRRKQIAELRPYVPGENMVAQVGEIGSETLRAISVNEDDRISKGSPKLGDMIARNPKDHLDQWLVEAKYFADNFEPIDLFEDT